MRILSVSVDPPYPPNDGRRHRTWHLLRQLAAQADVTLLTWSQEETPAGAIETVGGQVGTVLAEPVGPYRRSIPARVERQARFLLGGEPHYVQALMEQRRSFTARVSPLWQRVEALHRDAPFDIVSLEEEALCFLPLPVAGAGRVVLRHNVFQELVGGLRRSPVQRLRWCGGERQAWARYDRRVMDRCDVAVVPTPEMAAALGALDGSTRVAVVSNGVDVAPVATPPSAGGDVVFLGLMSYAPNVDAVRWFARAIWPRVLLRQAGASFRVVGRAPSGEVLSLVARDVTIVGEVDDISQACTGARLGVVPLRAGMGIKTKTLELMGMGLPVVTTPIGAEGIEAGPEDGLLVGRDALELASLVDGLLTDGDRADRLGAAARAFVGAHHSWETMGARLLAEYERVAARRGSGV